MNEIIEKYDECEIETLSPLHIGTGKELTPLDYIITNKVVIYDFQKLIREDVSFANRFLTQTASESIRRLFLDNILNDNQKNNTDYHLYTAEIDENTKQNLKKDLGRNKANIYEFIKTTDYKPYIPGSSIKGAIRTAIAYSIFKNNNNLKQELTKRLWKETSTIVNKLIFQGEKLDAKEDILKALYISDTEPLNPDTALKVEVAQRLSSKKVSDFKKYYETIKNGVITKFRMSFYPELIKIYQWKDKLNKENLIKSCNLFSQDIIKNELKYFNNHPEKLLLNNIIKFYENLDREIEKLKDNEVILCLGQGGGFYKKTLAILLENTENFPYAKFIRKFGRKTQGEQLQKTSRTILSNNQVLGWVKLSIE